MVLTFAPGLAATGSRRQNRKNRNIMFLYIFCLNCIRLRAQPHAGTSRQVRSTKFVRIVKCARRVTDKVRNISITTPATSDQSRPIGPTPDCPDVSAVGYGITRQTLQLPPRAKPAGISHRAKSRGHHTARLKVLDSLARPSARACPSPEKRGCRNSMSLQVPRIFPDRQVQP